MASNTAAQITTAVKSVLVHSRPARLLRLAATAAVVLTAIAAGTVILRAQQPQPPQVSYMPLAQDGGPQAGSFC
jgi:hypothetical protein